MGGTICKGGLIPVEVAFAAAKNVDIELSLEGLEVMNLGIVVGVHWKPSHIEEGKLDVAWRLSTVNGVTKNWLCRKVKGTIG